MNDYTEEETDEILGITRCAECGHRLEGEVDECPFCAVIGGLDGAVSKSSRHAAPLWIITTAMLMSFPLSLPWLITSSRLTLMQKIVTLLACLIWGGGIAVLYLW